VPAEFDDGREALLKKLRLFSTSLSTVILPVSFSLSLTAWPQSAEYTNGLRFVTPPITFSSSSFSTSGSSRAADLTGEEYGQPAAASGREESLPSAPEPGWMVGPGADPQREGAPWAAVWHQQPFSRIGIGADVSPLGIGIKGTTPLNDYFDARAVVNFLGFTSGRFEVDGFNVNANVHMATMGLALDFYPWNSVWRISGGMMFVNGNQISATTNIAGGTSFTLNSATYYSSNAVPLTGTALLGLHTKKPEPMVSFGFGRFVPHSNRHWSFPAEFGLIYMGSPALQVTTSGEICSDKKQTICTDVNSGTPLGQEFNSNLNAQLTRWRKDLNKVQFYPIFSTSVVYSFNIR
jgi:hypothetical protein